MPPVSQLRTSQNFQDALRQSAFGGKKADTIEPGEEFAPSADVHEVPAHLHRRSGQVIKPAKKRAFSQDISDAQIFFWCLVVILSGIYFMFWREEKFAVGFCGVPQVERTFPTCLAY